jgi:hypothetical protein
MARTPNRFTDPWTGSYYDWPINHSEEEAFGKTRNIDHTAPTSGLGLIRQQGDDTPMAVKLSGTIFHKAQHQAFIGWLEKSRTQTIYFRDFTGETFEVIVTAYQPTRQRTIRNPRDFANAPYHYWHYTLEMDVVRFIDGDWSVALP